MDRAPHSSPIPFGRYASERDKPLPDNPPARLRQVHTGSAALRTLRLVDCDAIVELEHGLPGGLTAPAQTDLQMSLRLVAPGIRAQFHGQVSGESLSTFERCLEALLIGREELAVLRTSGPQGALVQVRRVQEAFSLALFVTQATLQRSSFALQDVRLQQSDLDRLARWCAIGATSLSQQFGRPADC